MHFHALYTAPSEHTPSFSRDRHEPSRHKSPKVAEPFSKGSSYGGLHTEGLGSCSRGLSIHSYLVPLIQTGYKYLLSATVCRSQSLIPGGDLKVPENLRVQLKIVGTVTIFTIIYFPCNNLFCDCKKCLQSVNLVASFSFKNVCKIQIGGSLFPLSHSRRVLFIAPTISFLKFLTLL